MGRQAHGVGYERRRRRPRALGHSGISVESMGGVGAARRKGERRTEVRFRPGTIFSAGGHTLTQFTPGHTHSHGGGDGEVGTPSTPSPPPRVHIQGPSWGGWEHLSIHLPRETGALREEDGGDGESGASAASAPCPWIAAEVVRAVGTTRGEEG